MNQPAYKPRVWSGSAPVCDFCRKRVTGQLFYDAATHLGPWASMCLFHFMQHGLPMGQEYRRTGSDWVKSRNLNGQPDRKTLDDENAEMAAEEAQLARQEKDST